MISNIVMPMKKDYSMLIQVLSLTCVQYTSSDEARKTTGREMMGRRREQARSIVSFNSAQTSGLLNVQPSSLALNVRFQAPRRPSR